jgi:histone H3/H4
LRNILEKLGADIAKEAWEIARYAGRVTVIDVDIERASKKFTYNYW